MGKSVNQFDITFHSAVADGALALCAAIGLGAEAGAPEWVHLLPAGDIVTGDGRGPYRYAADALIAASLQGNDRLVLDENHSTDLAAPKGLAAPAMGWIVQLQARIDGVWGKVEWTEDGRRLVAGRAYRGISPVIIHDKAGNIAALLRASLVNKPNFKGLTTLHHQEIAMNLLARLLAALDLPEATGEDNLVAAIATMHQARTDFTTTLHAQMLPFAQAVGLGGGADAAAILAAITQLNSVGDAATIVSLQGELNGIAGELKTLRETTSRDKATAYVDAAIGRQVVNVKPLRDHYISRHMSDPIGVEKEIGAFVSLGPSGALPTPPQKIAGSDVSLQSEQLQVARMLGIDPKDYAATLEAERLANEEIR